MGDDAPVGGSIDGKPGDGVKAGATVLIFAAGAADIDELAADADAAEGADAAGAGSGKSTGVETESARATAAAPKAAEANSQIDFIGLS